ncbi:DUF4290 domain-containing protein [Rapidithrix thailandica]|uniref:DUF4290 domain-containing protein n=1 Tax=Rapidithrix thailandica TaxID=413964 RepID=A0AAW9S2X6_9BACT
MEYNTLKDPLLLKEYGRNVQKLVDYITTIENKNERTEYAHALVNLMKQLNPSVKENSDNFQRIWDHLYIMSDFTLDIDGPYPKPEREILERKPEKMFYKTNEVKFRHYGRNIELLLRDAKKIENPEEQKKAYVQVGKLMKTLYSSWNKESIENNVIYQHLEQLVGKPLNLINEPREMNDIFNTSYRDRSSDKADIDKARPTPKKKGKRRK